MGLTGTMVMILAMTQDPQSATLLEQIEKEWTAVAEKVQASVVEVKGRYRRFSGVIVSRDGYILTDASGIGRNRKVFVRLPGHEEFTSSKEIHIDRLTGLAIVKVEASDLEAIEFALEHAPTAGAPVMVCGNPYGIGKSVSRGTIAATGRKVQTQRRQVFEDLLQISASASPGDGGSLVADVRGNLVGIVIAGGGASRRPGPSGGAPTFTLTGIVPYAVPADVAEFVARQLMKTGSVKRGWLGVTVRDPTQATRDQLEFKGGAVVERFADGGPAHEKLKRNDILIRLSDEPIVDLHSLRMAVWKLEAGAAVTVELLRGGEILRVELTVGREPEKSR